MNERLLSSIQKAIRDELVPQIRAISVETGSLRVTIHIYHKEPIPVRTICSCADVILAKLYLEFPGSGFSSPEFNCEFHKYESEELPKYIGLLVFPENPPVLR